MNNLINYFFRQGLNALQLHFLHLTFSAITSIFVAETVDLHFLQTNFFLNNRASASGNFAILYPQIFIYKVNQI